MKEYKIVTQKYRRFSGTLEPGQLELAMNSCAVEGWEYKALARSLTGAMNPELVIIFERDKK
jgi:hypothetical protein